MKGEKRSVGEVQSVGIYREFIHTSANAYLCAYIYIYIYIYIYVCVCV